MKQNQSSYRLNEIAREKIASIIMFEISDPRLDFVTVTACQVSVDRSYCKVYVSAHQDEYDEVLAGLQSAKGRIRLLLGKNLGWRVTPDLSFHIDVSTDEAQRIAQALQDVPKTMSVAKDENGYPL